MCISAPVFVRSPFHALCPNTNALLCARGRPFVTVHLNPPFPVHRGFHDAPSVRARVPSVRYFFNGFLLLDSPLGLIHRSSFPFTSQQSKGYYQDISNVDAVTHTLQLRVGQPRFHGQSGRGYKVLEWILRWHAYILVHFPRYQ